ncbi:hypothetical protein [Burkholderia ubonensis]|uniref:hypothetical protein n=1 Tax=Burkholderia ubonensis TaxID=101571 RepID=UPI002ABDD706|nr:hypothetical protein [Burkholderia ubonensis]
MEAFETLRTHSDAGVLFAEIDSGPMNLIGTKFVRDIVSLINVLDRGDYRVVLFTSAHADFFIPHVDVTQVKEYRKRSRSPDR